MIVIAIITSPGQHGRQRIAAAAAYIMIEIALSRAKLTQYTVQALYMSRCRLRAVNEYLHKLTLYSVFASDKLRTCKSVSSKGDTAYLSD